MITVKTLFIFLDNQVNKKYYPLKASPKLREKLSNK